MTPTEKLNVIEDAIAGEVKQFKRPIDNIAELLTSEYERVSANITDMGSELKQTIERHSSLLAAYHKALTDLDETAKAYRDEGKRIFEETNRLIKLAEEVSHQAADMREKISG